MTNLWIDCEVHVLPPDWCRPGWYPDPGEDVLRRVLYDHPERDRALPQAHIEGVLAEMAMAGIDRAVITGLPWRATAMNWRNNEYVARCAADHPGRFYPFGLLPHPGSDDPVAAVRRLKREFGCRGVKVIPSWQGWRLDDSSLDPVWRAMVEEDLILMTHTDHPFLPSEGHDPPHALLAVIRRHPELRVLAPHLGGMLAIYALHPPLRPLLANTLFVCSVPATMRMTLYAIDAAGPDNVAFGTDFPFNPSHDQRTVRRAFEALPMDEEIRAAVAGGNAARFLAG